eukprot:1223714-Lingulodinium_polyedra.AAC.1
MNYIWSRLGEREESSAQRLPIQGVEIMSFKEEWGIHAFNMDLGNRVYLKTASEVRGRDRRARGQTS